MAAAALRNGYHSRHNRPMHILLIEDDLDLGLLPAVTLHRGAVPGELDPGRFFAKMCTLVLDRTPINFHREARARRRSA